MGYHCTLALAQKCPQSLIVVASRTNPENSAATINKKLNQSNVKYMKLDLSSKAQVRQFDAEWKAANHPPIHALVLNAALQLPNEVQLSEDGIEKTFAVNHVGHALLFHLLASNLTSDARVVITASGVHDPAAGWGMKPQFTTAEAVSKGRLPGESGLDRYATTKLANVMWCYALARHVSAARKSWTVTSFDPGFMPSTGLVREANAVVRFTANKVLPKMIGLMRLWKSNIHLPQESGETLAWLAVSDEVKGKTGQYYEERKEKDGSVLAREKEKQGDLWKWTVEFIGKDEAERQRFERLE